jgi:hypothetical protein
MNTNSETSKTKVNVEFNIVADNFNPDDISSELGMKPSRSYRIYEQVKDKPIFRDHSLWQIETGYQYSWDINDQLSQIVNIFKDKSDLLLHIIEKYKAYIEIVIVINFENDDKPAIYFDAELICFLNSINAGIQFDYYLC